MFARMFLGVIAKWLDGYKTYIAGFGLILNGIVGIIGYYWPDAGLPHQDPSKALDTIAMGLMAIGFGRKLDKVIGGRDDVKGSA